MGRTTINVSEDVSKKLHLIKKNRNQDDTMSDTLVHILYVYEEQKFRQTHIALRAANEAPTKNPITGHVLNPTIDADKTQLVSTRDNLFVQVGEVKKP